MQQACPTAGKIYAQTMLIRESPPKPQIGSKDIASNEDLTMTFGFAFHDTQHLKRNPGKTLRPSLDSSDSVWVAEFSSRRRSESCRIVQNGCVSHGD